MPVFIALPPSPEWAWNMGRKAEAETDSSHMSGH